MILIHGEHSLPVHNEDLKYNFLYLYQINSYLKGAI